ncbi:MAG TPA: glycine cleavage system aminomethyltransferase GcvT [Planctomycetaceae bacterium]|nr:glycine cleavage system aminomethyltransferase GcvT [Planctomycetaceae bacterium]
MDTQLLRTPCYDWHVAHGGRMVDFAGWAMPVQYASVTDEHHAVRRAAGVFDIAHMGRLRFAGTDAGRVLDRLVTANLADMQPGQVRYALVTNERGGILDDVLVYRFDDSWLLVVNASNRLKILSWIEERSGGFDFQLTDDTFSQFMLAVQGPRALEIVNPLVKNDVAEINYYWAVRDNVMGVDGLVSRTGYTGEDGFEVILPAEHGPRLWEAVIERGRAHGLVPCGLGSRDTLRLEAAMPLYGHELSEDLDPFTAGLAFAVKLDKGDFIGRDALVALKARADRPQRVGLELAGRRIAREGSAVYAGERAVGRVTSGTFSPTFEKPLAMAYVARESAAPGTPLDVDIRGRRERAAVVKLPFYRRG